MRAVTLKVPDSLADWIDRQVASGRFTDADDYVRDLLRRDRESELSESYLSEALSEGEASGPGTRSIAELLDEVRREFANASLAPDRKG